MKKIVLVISFFLCGVHYVLGQTYVDICSVIHSTISKDETDPWSENRNAIELLKQVPINSSGDTIFAIECFSEIDGDYCAMYWSNDFLYSVYGGLYDTMKVYTKPFWHKWIISLASLWDTNTLIQSKMPNGYGPDVHYCFSRTIFHPTYVHTDYLIIENELDIPYEYLYIDNEFWPMWKNRNDFIAVYVLEKKCCNPHIIMNHLMTRDFNPLKEPLE